MSRESCPICGIVYGMDNGKNEAIAGSRYFLLVAIPDPLQSHLILLPKLHVKFFSELPAGFEKDYLMIFDKLLEHSNKLSDKNEVLVLSNNQIAEYSNIEHRHQHILINAPGQ
jgi:diadenosine tetraphosphate (Ap4A) HIT family hydrolase